MPKTLASLCVLLLFAPLAAHAATPEEQAVLAPVQAMFDGMAHRDPPPSALPFCPADPSSSCATASPCACPSRTSPPVVARPGTTKIEERIHDPLIRIDNDLAVVWAPFEFLSDGKVDHCGTDLFNLVRQDGQWLIADVADTGRKTCPSQ